MNILLTLDIKLFTLINHLPHTSITDAIALALSGVGTAGIIWFLIAAVLFVREEKKDHWFFLPFAAAGTVSWFFVEIVAKPLVARSRPGLEAGTILVGSSGDGFSFPSGHATIAFALANILSHKEPRFRWFLYTLAVLIALSRVYLGVHYPLDVIAGGVLGWGIGRITLLGMHVHRT